MQPENTITWAEVLSCCTCCGGRSAKKVCAATNLRLHRLHYAHSMLWCFGARVRQTPGQRTSHERQARQPRQHPKPGQRVQQDQCEDGRDVVGEQPGHVVPELEDNCTCPNVTLEGMGMQSSNLYLCVVQGCWSRSSQGDSPRLDVRLGPPGEAQL